MAPSGQLTGWIRAQATPLPTQGCSPPAPPEPRRLSCLDEPRSPLGLTGEGQTPSRGPLKMGETWNGEHSACRGSRRPSSSPTPLAQGASHLDPARPVPGHRGGARDPGARPWTHRSQRGDPRLQGHMGTCCGDMGRGSAASLLASPHPSEMCWVGDAAELGQASVFPSHTVPLASPKGQRKPALGSSRAVAITRTLGL